MLVHGYLAEILSTPGEYLEYWEDALCCSTDVQLFLEPYGPYADEVKIPEEYLDEDDMSKITLAASAVSIIMTYTHLTK